MTTFLFMAKTTSADSIEPKGGVYELELSGTCSPTTDGVVLEVMYGKIAMTGTLVGRNVIPTNGSTLYTAFAYEITYYDSHGNTYFASDAYDTWVEPIVYKRCPLAEYYE